MLINRRKKKRLRAGLILFLVVCLCSLMIVLLEVRENDRFKNVLLQMNKNFSVHRTEEGFVILLEEKQKLDDTLSFLEKIVSQNNGVIRQYDLRQEDGFLTVVFQIEDVSKRHPGFRFLVRKKRSTGDILDQTPWPRTFKARICLVIDDAGYSNDTLDDFIRLPVKMGIAILPFLEKSAETARRVFQSKKEVLLHLPMEPKDYESRKIRLFPKEILNSMTEEQVQESMEEMLVNLKYAVGANNHQGSSATENEATMQKVLKFLKARDLFFIDSLTSPESVTEKVALRLALNYGKRDVFLDNRDDYGYIKGQVERLIHLALRKGKAIGIGHVNHRNTCRVLKDYLPVFQEKGIQVVYPSEIVNKYYDKEVSKNVKENILFHN